MFEILSEITLSLSDIFLGHGYGDNEHIEAQGWHPRGTIMYYMVPLLVVACGGYAIYMYRHRKKHGDHRDD